jgi:hypothetical protein
MMVTQTHTHTHHFYLCRCDPREVLRFFPDLALEQLPYTAKLTHAEVEVCGVCVYVCMCVCVCVCVCVCG